MAASSVLSFAWVPTPTDGLTSDTLTAQLDTEQDISSLLTTFMSSNTGSDGALLQRESHVTFLLSFLRASKPLPAGFTALDASRPWLLYWCIHSLALLDRQLDASAQQRVVTTLASCYNEQSGGYGGGPGQLSHLAPSYATVSALCYMGKPGWDSIDRPGMYKFLMSLKQPDGSFIMHQGGEVDVRGCYCALVIASLLNILTPELAHNTSQFIASCQTYEGGLASSAAATDVDMPSPPLGEAHGGYAFCAVASYAMLRALDDPYSPASIGSSQTEKQLDLKSLMRWSCTMQAMPIEGGGFRGRTNKLVDGCYSLWCGGLFGLLNGLLNENATKGHHVAGDLYDRRALQEYVLYAAQAPQGGLRDKPGKHADGYHTCYNLSGLSAAQHEHTLRPDTLESARQKFKSPFKGSRVVDVEEKQVEMIQSPGESENEAELRMREVWARAVAWTAHDKIIVGDASNEVLPAHPVFNLVEADCRAMLSHFYLQES
ncbi:CAAX farnesyltransferase (FTase) subunit beta [Microbotryomycetes sp. JL221]|nr:CAAX farnesyltransferase (FTase) subunit beta [Microbotryomycetes sp. JL221]